MKRFWLWLLLEYKRAVKILPFVLAEAMVLMIFIGTIAFCAQKLNQRGDDQEKAVIALAAEEDNSLLNMAVSYVESMESVKSFCRFEHVSPERGKEMLQSGEALAMIELPETMVEGILNGENQPAVLYMPKETTSTGQVFEALAEAGIGMLQVAQAEIYAINDIAVENSRSDSISDMEYDINIFNINLAFNRENAFKMRSMSVTENIPIVSYYCAAGLVLYLLLNGLSLCIYFDRTNQECERQLRTAGVGLPLQVLGKVSVAAFLLSVSGLLPLLIYTVLHKMGLLTLYLHPMNLLGGVLCVGCTAVILVLIYRCTDNLKGALLCIGFLSLILCFVSGIFLPSALLPVKIRTLAEWLPTTWMKRIWLGWFQQDSTLGTEWWKVLLFSLAGYGIMMVPAVLRPLKKEAGRRRI